MLHLSFLLAAALALSRPALCSPADTLQSRQSCEGQSCTIAALSGSSGQVFNPSTPPAGGSDEGDCCIIHYNPAVKQELYKLRPALKTECPKFNANTSYLERRDDFAAKRLAEATIQSSTCTPYTLLYAKGTAEPGELGVTVGPALASGLDLASPGKWTVTGVDYNNTVDGDYCVGLPGGMIFAKLLESTAKACPKTKIIMSGYSEGAMVTHNGIAYACAEARKRVLAAVVFGDPFDGAPIKGYSGPIKTYCASGDQVCDGLFNISLAHLSYVGIDTTEAVAYMEKVVGASTT